MQNLPGLMHIAALALGGVGAWLQTSVVKDPSFMSQFGDWSDVPGWLSMIAGVVTALGAQMVSSSNHKNLETAIVKTEQKVEVAKQEVEIAAAAPSTVPEGVDPVRHRLNLTVIEALNNDHWETAEYLMKAYPLIGKGS